MANRMDSPAPATQPYGVAAPGTAAGFIEAAVENTKGTDAVNAAETNEPGVHKRDEIGRRDRARGRIGEVRAVMETLRTRSAMDSALSEGGQEAAVRRVKLESAMREAHQQQMLVSRPRPDVAQANAILASLTPPSQLLQLTRQMQHLTQQLTQQLTGGIRPDRGEKVLAQLMLATPDPVTRFAVMQLARATLIERGFSSEAAQLDESIDEIYALHGEEVRVACNTAAAANTLFGSHVEREKFRHFYAQTLSAELTPRYLFDGLLELGGADRLHDTASVMAQALRDDMLALRTSVPRDQLARLYSYLDLFNKTQVARSMLSNAKEFFDLVRAPEQASTKQSLDLCREFFLLGSASMPGPVIDKIADRLCGKDAVKRASMVQKLYRHSAGWPEHAWAGSDARLNAEKQFLKRLDQHFESSRRAVLYAVDVGKRHLKRADR